MPGVADQIRKTNLKNDQKARKQEMEELIKMVEEGRLHEADERQMETLKLSLELNRLLTKGTNSDTPPKVEIPSDEIAQAIKNGVEQVLTKLGTNSVAFSDNNVSEATNRPSMRHASFGDLAQSGGDVEISGDLETESKSSDDGASKLEKLRKLKGNG